MCAAGSSSQRTRPAPAADGGRKSSNYQVRALERGLDILDAFSLAMPELTLTRLAQRVNLPKSTVVRLASILAERGYLERVQGEDIYRIGVHTFAIGSIYMQTMQFESEARPIMARLADETGQTANLGILDRGELVHIAVVAPDRPVRYWASVGKREDPHYTGLGKVLLASLPSDELSHYLAPDDLVRRTSFTITDSKVLRAELDRVLKAGYAIDDEESNVGVRCIAAPIVDRDDAVVAAVSISGAKPEFSDDVMPRYVRMVVRAASDISQRLGGRDHGDLIRR